MSGSTLTAVVSFSPDGSSGARRGSSMQRDSAKGGMDSRLDRKRGSLTVRQWLNEGTQQQA